MPSRLLSPVFLALALWLSQLCATQAAAAQLTVSAASSLTEAFKEIAAAFTASAPGITVRLNFASSGTLLQQIASGAPVDVLASADGQTMDEAQKQGLIQAAGRRNFAGNTLVVIVPASASQEPGERPRTLADLAQPALRLIAIGNPDSVPAGRYARRALESARLWRAVDRKSITGQNVRQVLAYVARGEVDAGLVYATDAALMPGKVAVAFAVPLQQPLVYPIAPVAGSAHAGQARSFVDFVTSPAAQAILLRHGFSPPQSDRR